MKKKNLIIPRVTIAGFVLFILLWLPIHVLAGIKVDLPAEFDNKEGVLLCNDIDGDCALYSNNFDAKTLHDNDKLNFVALNAEVSIVLYEHERTQDGGGLFISISYDGKDSFGCSYRKLKYGEPSISENENVMGMCSEVPGAVSKIEAGNRDIYVVDLKKLCREIDHNNHCHNYWDDSVSGIKVANFKGTQTSLGDGVETPPGTPEGVSLGLAEKVDNLYNQALGIGALLAVGILVYAGFLYIVSAGNPSKIGDAKKWIWAALSGLFILFGAFIILNFINPDLTTLEDPFLAQAPHTEGDDAQVWTGELFDPADCLPAQPGNIKLRSEVKRIWGDIGVSRAQVCRAIRNSDPPVMSVHGLGRALDIHYDKGDPGEKAGIISVLLENQVKIGLLKIIDYRGCRVWRLDRRDWRDLPEGHHLCTGGWGHIHTELTETGALSDNWSLSPVDPFPPRRPGDPHVPQ